MGAVPNISGEQFLFDQESLDPSKEKEREKKRGHTDLYYYLCRRAREGGRRT